MIRTSPCLLFQILLIICFSIIAISLSAQREEPKDEVEVIDEAIVRSYDTQRYFKERRWNTGRASDMPMGEDIGIGYYPREMLDKNCL